MSDIITLFLLLALDLISRYPKVRITDAFLITDLSDAAVYLVLFYIGPVAAAIALLIVNLVPQAYTRIESPMEALVRIVSMAVGMAVFMLFASHPLYYALTAGVLASSYAWALISFFGFSIANPTMFVIALARGVLIYRIMETVGCCGM